MSQGLSRAVRRAVWQVSQHLHRRCTSQKKLASWSWSRSRRRRILQLGPRQVLRCPGRRPLPGRLLGRLPGRRWTTAPCSGCHMTAVRRELTVGAVLALAEERRRGSRQWAGACRPDKLSKEQVQGRGRTNPHWIHRTSRMSCRSARRTPSSTRPHRTLPRQEGGCSGGGLGAHRSHHLRSPRPRSPPETGLTTAPSCHCRRMPIRRAEGQVATQDTRRTYRHRSGTRRTPGSATRRTRTAPHCCKRGRERAARQHWGARTLNRSLGWWGSTSLRRSYPPRRRCRHLRRWTTESRCYCP